MNKLNEEMILLEEMGYDEDFIADFVYHYLGL